MENSAGLSDWIQTVLTGILAFLTYLYVRTTGRQLKAMRDALAQTVRSNEATEKSNEIAEQSFELATRAWLIPTMGERHLLTNTLDLTLHNVGKVPATDVVVRQGFFPSPPGINPRPLTEIGRGLVVVAGVNPSVETEPRPINSDDALSGSVPVLYLYCEIEYRDIFKKSRKTTACWQFGPDRSEGWDWMLAPEGNTME